MTSRFSRLTLATTLAFLVPGASQGQTRLWDSYCTPGAFQACASVSVSLLQLGGGGSMPQTAVTVRIRNLEGTLGTPGAWGLQGLTLTNLQGLWPCTGCGDTESPTFEGTAHGVGTPGWPNWWVTSTNPGYPASLNRERQGGDGAFAIVGCSPLTPDAQGLFPQLSYGGQGQTGYYQTCGEGWVAYNLTVPEIQFTDSTTLSFYGYTDQGLGVSCTGCQSAVPEPVTMTLLGTGLVGIGAVRWRRRRWNGAGRA